MTAQRPSWSCGHNYNDPSNPCPTCAPHPYEMSAEQFDAWHYGFCNGTAPCPLCDVVLIKQPVSDPTLCPVCGEDASADRHYHCGACGERASSYGHHSTHCKVTGKTTEFHACCPGACALQSASKRAAAKGDS